MSLGVVQDAAELLDSERMHLDCLDLSVNMRLHLTEAITENDVVSCVVGQGEVEPHNADAQSLLPLRMMRTISLPRCKALRLRGWPYLQGLMGLILSSTPASPRGSMEPLPPKPERPLLEAIEAVRA